MHELPIIIVIGKTLVHSMHELGDPGDLEELAAFAAVAETGSFAKAAKVLRRDPSVLSRRISSLERRLNVRLLTRTTRRVGMTEAGQLYLHRVQPLLDELASANREVSDFAASPQGVVRVSLPVTFGRQWIAPILPAILARYPALRIEARFADRFVDLVAEGFDVAVRVGVVALGDSSLSARKLATYRNILVAAPSYLAAKKTPQSPDELLTHSCVGFTGHVAWPDWHLTNGAVRKTIRPPCALAADHAEAVLMAAIDGAGITLVADWLAGPALRAGQLTEVLPGWRGKGEGSVYVVLPPGRLVPTKTRVFVDEVARAIKSGWRGGETRDAT